MRISSLRSGFTLVEMIVVMAIIGILLSIGLFPYRYYMQRASVEGAGDALAQEWILAHTNIRNGLLYDTNDTMHASLVFVFETGASEVRSYLITGSTTPDISALKTVSAYKTLSFENGVKILGFTGAIDPSESAIRYSIKPPDGNGTFLTGSTSIGVFLTGARIILGYEGAPAGTGRSREILLRPYLQGD